MTTSRPQKLIATLTAGSAFLLVLLPLVMVFASPLFAQDDGFFRDLRHIFETNFWQLIQNTVVLLAGVGVGTLILGVGLAWLVAVYRFPGRKIVEKLLLLPLAIPAYVMAFVMLGLSEWGGLLFTFAKQTGLDFLITDFRHPLGVIFVMTLVLYPYVYMLARAAFLQQSASLFDAARLLGCKRSALFWKVALPIAWPSIVTGLSLVLMETLADFGAVSIFNYNTFTTAIYKTWFGLFDLEAAAVLSMILVLFALSALTLERHMRQKKNRAILNPKRHYSVKAKPHEVIFIWSILTILLSMTFLLPCTQLVLWAMSTLQESEQIKGLWFNLLNAVEIGLFTTIVVITLSVTLALIKKRIFKNKFRKNLINWSLLGYSLPGTVLAVGVLLTLSALSGILDWIGIGTKDGIIGVGSLIGLIYALSIRFLAVGFGPVEQGLDMIKPVYQEVAITLSASKFKRLKDITLPLLRPSLATASMLVFIDVMKEMPATLLLRPFGFDTLAVKIFELTSEGEWERAALPAIMLVLIGLVPIFWMTRRSA